MERRGFLKSVVGGGALGATPWAAMATFAEPGAAAQRKVTVIGQAELPEAMHMAGGLAAALGGVAAAVSTVRLGSFAEVTGLLDGAAGARVLGVMDDASALIFQQIAAARGAGLVMDTHRRVGKTSLVSFAIDA